MCVSSREKNRQLRVSVARYARAARKTILGFYASRPRSRWTMGRYRRREKFSTLSSGSRSRSSLSPSLRRADTSSAHGDIYPRDDNDVLFSGQTFPPRAHRTDEKRARKGRNTKNKERQSAQGNKNPERDTERRGEGNVLVVVAAAAPLVKAPWRA